MNDFEQYQDFLSGFLIIDEVGMSTKENSYKVSVKYSNNEKTFYFTNHIKAQAVMEMLTKAMIMNSCKE